MRIIQEVITLSRFFTKFLVRRAFSMGALRYRGIQILLGFLATVLLLVLTAISYMYYNQAAEQKNIARLISSLANVTLPLWVSIGFIIVRLLFLKASSMIMLAESLPVTAAQRSVALFLNELKLIGIILVVTFFSSVAPLPIVYGFDTIAELVLAIVLPAVTFVGILALAYNILAWVFKVIGLGRLRSILSLVVLLMLASLPLMNIRSSVTEITLAYQSGTPVFLWSNMYSWLAYSNGTALSLMVAIVANVGVYSLAVGSSGDLFIKQSEFSLVWNSRGERRRTKNPRVVSASRELFGAYLRNVARSQETWITLVVAIGGFLVLLPNQVVPPVLIAELVAFLGVYSYSSTRALRSFPVLLPNPVGVYSFLCFSLLAVVAPLALGLFAVFIMFRGDVIVGLLSVLACIMTVPVMVTIGVLVPAERDNPVAVILSSGIAVMCFVFIILGVSILSLSPQGWSVVLTIFLFFVIFTGIAAISGEFRSSAKESL